MTVPSYECICDTSIWVNVCLAGVHETYIREFSSIGIADVVKNEILKWERNDGRFKKIFNLFREYENNGLFVINRENIDPITKRIIENELLMWGFTDLDNTTKNIDNLGEFASLLYAYHLEVPYIHAHDINFCDTIQFDELFTQYKGIQMITWYELSEQITSDHTERMAITKRVEEESRIMNNQNKMNMQEKILEDKLTALQNFFSNR